MRTSDDERAETGRTQAGAHTDLGGEESTGVDPRHRIHPRTVAGVYRFLLTPRWWAINIFVVTAIPFCLFMGSWQLSRFEDRASSHQEYQDLADQAVQQEAKPLAGLLPVDKETSGRSAEASGTYDTEHQFLSPGRTLDGDEGSYVITLLRTTDGTAAPADADATDATDATDDADITVLPVVRGWLAGEPDPAAVPPPPEGEVTVSGALQSSETTGGKTGLPEGQVDRISAASLVNLVPYDVHNAWITVVSPDQLQDPLKGVPPVAPKDSGLDMKAFQNLGYTAEWFVFAAFVMFMWFRFYRRDIEVARDAELGLLADPTADPRSPDAEGATAPEETGDPKGTDAPQATSGSQLTR